MHARQEGLDRYLTSWSPGPVTVRDELPAEPAARLSGLLDQPPLADGVLPPLWHWLYFLDWPAQSELGTDGHPRDGHFLPPLPDRRRMFAGGRAEWHAPLRLGTPTTRVSSLQDAVPKQGSTGELVFVTVRQEYSQQSRLCLVEETDLVYRSGAAERQAAPAIDLTGTPPDEGAWRLTAAADPTMLFRFSTLIANAHRIHYDEPYTKDVEGFPGLVVHGPLLVLLMLELVRRNQPERTVHSVAFRLRSPLFCGEQLAALGESHGGEHADLRVATAREPRHATAEVTFVEGTKPETRRP